MKAIRKNITFEFHISAASRKKYKLDENLFTITGDLIVPDFATARKLANQINNIRKKEGSDLTTPGQMNALGLIHEIFHYLIGIYEEKINPGVFKRSLERLNKIPGKTESDKVLFAFIGEFPPLDVYKGKILPENYLAGATSGKPNREILIEEIILLYLQNINPAVSNLADLYTDKPLSDKTKYLHFLDETEKFFINEKPFPKENLPLLQFLRKPIVLNPYNLEGQLDFILKEWGAFVSEKFGKRLLGGKDLIHEDYKLFVKHGGGEKGTPPVPVYEFDEEYFRKLRARLLAGEHLSSEELLYYQTEYEKFTTDIGWMPRVVMLAKNVHVWLDQLSKKYRRSITRLDQIPDEELDRIAGWNFTALWLIGIWERSSASRKIKNLTGNPEAVSSAYSLYDYIIAWDIGGEEAFNNLKHRAASRGIRMASDMVPNHMGIYSKWVIEKPYYFIQREDPPYPSYSFYGPDLSEDGRVAIRIEDKYYSRSDAAVVFQRVDKYTGDTKYIYHGNDGTNMPWNDTAQLNLLIPEVRESVYQTIKHVAGMFPIIRFDAAMTLSKKHYQRLWFPIPGTAGAVPSRAEYSMTREQFDEQMPHEFWREVVDRMKSEMPETLLLAEAFWLMEGYFVRTLGMHRVYNSAFMHMMMKEENEKYRILIKNTLDFNPEILKRYVNFMSNPDEETAVNQFGKGDKYLGVCVTMITMPGLPMFGHGQIEGFSEKYGMEYKKAYYDESPDENLIRTHEDQVFPLMKKRYLFSQVENFELFDFINDEGHVNESVFAYSNHNGYERTLVLFNNSWIESRGYIKNSVLKAAGDGRRGKTLAEALFINPDYNIYYIYKNYKTKLEYLVPGTDIYNSGIYFHLTGYEYSVLLDFREVYDNDGAYGRLNDYLHGQGVLSVESAKWELVLAPLHYKLSSLFEPHIIEEIKSISFEPDEKGKLSEQFLSRINTAVDEINTLTQMPLDKNNVVKQLDSEFSSIRNFNRIVVKKSKEKRKSTWFENAKNKLIYLGNDGKNENNKNIIISSLIMKNLQSKSVDENGSYFFDRFLLDRIIPVRLKEMSPDRFDAYKDYRLIKVLSNRNISDGLEKRINFNVTDGKPNKNPYSNEASSFMLNILDEFQLRNFIGVNDYNGIMYFNKERFEEAVDCFFTLYNLTSFLKIKPSSGRNSENVSKNNEKFILDELQNSNIFFSELKIIAAEKGYKLEDFRKEFQLLHEKKPAITKSKKKTSVKSDKKKKPITKKRG
ncbi:MAG TPA: alpha-amylase family glycosyl hydrolase [Ignavibacteriaceae bacterium]|nr:alpha-amylase family glycosyl hydrolase [Ignavibacteriaceae bacterium]